MTELSISLIVALFLAFILWRERAHAHSLSELQRLIHTEHQTFTHLADRQTERQVELAKTLGREEHAQSLRQELDGIRRSIDERTTVIRDAIIGSE